MSCRNLRKFGCYCFQVLGTEDGPSVRTKFALNLDYCSFLQSNLNLGVHGFDESSRSLWL